jgi:hypothetical protein
VAVPDPSGRAPFLLVPLIEAPGSEVALAAGEWGGGSSEDSGEAGTPAPAAPAEEAPAPAAQRRRPLARETKSFGGGGARE